MAQYLWVWRDPRQKNIQSAMDNEKNNYNTEGSGVHYLVTCLLYTKHDIEMNINP